MRPVTALCLCLTLAACGFQLRGAGPQGLSAPAALAPAAGSDAATLAALRRAGLSLAPAAETALEVAAAEWRRETVSVDAAGRPLGYRLHLRLRYRLIRGGTPGPWRTLDLFRDYASPPGEALAREDQEAPLREELWREAAQGIAMALRP